jgi:gluconolactonase
MKNPIVVFALALMCAAPLCAQNDFPLTEDSKPKADVPKGEMLRFSFDKSKIFPGTSRDVSVYVPRQYDGMKPACVYVNQDGVQWNAPTVFDNLIAKGEMPVTIGIFVTPGVVKAANANALPRFNRSYEYDGLGDNYARFLIEELLPEVETKKTQDGRAIVLSKSANDRAIGGSSSGAVCAFTAAWERPDAFSRVFSAIGTYVGLRGAHEYPTLIRKIEPKPIRVFLQGGSNDNNIYGGDWWIANQAMQRSLAFAGYENQFVWGNGGHNGAHGSQVFPDAMRYLWKDWPQPVKAGLGSPQLKEILIPGEEWQETNELVTNVRSSQAESLPNLSAYINQAVATHGGLIYAVSQNSEEKEIQKTRLFLIRTGQRFILENSFPTIRALTLSADQTLLYIADNTHWIYSYQIQPDGTLAHGQKYYHLHTLDTSDNAGAAGMCVDRDGRLYVATAMGIQVCDQAGRVNCIIPVPGGAATSVVLGGADFDTLFVASGGKIYKRKVKTKGAPSFLPPVKPAPPRL